MRAFMLSTAMNDPTTAVTFYDFALDEILSGGMKRWANVPIADKGAVFGGSFIRGVKVLRLEALMKAHVKAPKKYPLGLLQTSAAQLLLDVLSDSIPTQLPSDPEHFPGFLLSFWSYCIGDALAILALCEKELGRRGPQAWANQIRAAELYADAALSYPEDDEYRCWYLNLAVTCYRSAKAPASTILPLLDSMKQALPKVKQIWEHSQLGVGGGHHMFQMSLAMEKDLRKEARQERGTL